MIEGKKMISLITVMEECSCCVHEWYCNQLKVHAGRKAIYKFEFKCPFLVEVNSDVKYEFSESLEGHRDEGDRVTGSESYSIPSKKEKRKYSEYTPIEVTYIKQVIYKKAGNLKK